jgi:hypothetical protein
MMLERSDLQSWEVGEGSNCRMELAGGWMMVPNGKFAAIQPVGGVGLCRPPQKVLISPPELRAKNTFNAAR